MVSIAVNKSLERNALFWQRCNLKPEGEARGLQCAEDKITSLPNVGRDCGGCKYCNKQFTAYEVKSLYDIAYNRFKKWCAEKNVQVYSENVLLAYFSENAKNYKSSTLWAQYSMVKSCLIIYDNIDISKFPKLIAFLKKTGDGYQAKKSKILTKSEIDRFLSSADDKEFLMIKVGLILGIAGACRTDELVNLTVDDIEDVGSSLIVKIPNTKTKIP
ncbi:hypothetical protein NQ317_002270 [Molorchus minor]|uniref:Tyr recombinase domain-containing protein n=1 Tax=Molorchus minor TaxID=1323400 RepID=A0ABQ9J3K4_9CUCU|nr:hypothetical protein NQ317_002270 [Molorchus minor]